MPTVEYELKSEPGRVVSIPEEYAKKAEEIVKLSEDPIKFLMATTREDCMKNAGVALRGAILFSTERGTQAYARLQDALYLRVCMYENSQRLKKGSEEARTIDRTLGRLIIELDKPQA